MHFNYVSITHPIERVRMRRAINLLIIKIWLLQLLEEEEDGPPFCLKEIQIFKQLGIVDNCKICTIVVAHLSMIYWFLFTHQVGPEDSNRFTTSTFEFFQWFSIIVWLNLWGNVLLQLIILSVLNLYSIVIRNRVFMKMSLFKLLDANFFQQ